MSGTLREFERWLLGEIERPRAPRGARRRRAEREIAPSLAMSALARLELYRGMVRARLVECLRTEFAAVERAVGPRRFAALAKSFVQSCPSTHFSLNQFGARFPEFLHGRRLPRFVVDLARLERAIEEVFDAPQDSVMSSDDLQGIPARRWSTLQLRPIAALRVVETTSDVDRYLEAVVAGRDARVVRRATRILVWRRGSTVQRRSIEPIDARLLDALARSRSLKAALERVPGSPQDQVFAFFRRAAEDGLLRAPVERVRKTYQ